MAGVIRVCLLYARNTAKRGSRNAHMLRSPALSLPPYRVLARD